MLEVIKKFKWVIIGVAGLMILCAVFVVLHNNGAFVNVPPEPENTDFTGQEEVLNEHLTELVKKDPYAGYVSESTQTRYTLVSPDYFYDATKKWWNVCEGSAKNGASITAFATVISALSDKLITPASVGYIAKSQDIWNLCGNAPDDLIEKLANYYGLFYREVPAMNSNILNYYLDQDTVVIIYGSGKTPYTENGAYLVVLGGYPSDESYLVSSPTDAHYRNNQATRIEILEMLTGNEKFYVLSGYTNRPDFVTYSDEFNFKGEK